jgi:hypothetical protein
MSITQFVPDHLDHRERVRGTRDGTPDHQVRGASRDRLRRREDAALVVVGGGTGRTHSEEFKGSEYLKISNTLDF